MKKRWLSILLLAALGLVGCQPTTNIAVVTPKNNLTGVKTVAEDMVGNVPEQVKAPETYSFDLKSEENLMSVKGTARVTVPEVEGIRLKKVETRTFNQDDMDNMQENLMQGAELWKRVCTAQNDGMTLTKSEISDIDAEIEEQYKESVQEAKLQGYEPDEFYWEDLLEYWMAMREMAPESYPTQKVETEIRYDAAAAEKFNRDGEVEQNKNTIYGNLDLNSDVYSFWLNNNWIQDRKLVSAIMVRERAYSDVNLSLYSPTEDWIKPADTSSVNSSEEEEALQKDGQSAGEIMTEAVEQKKEAAGAGYDAAAVDGEMDKAEQKEYDGQEYVEESVQTSPQELKKKGDELLGSLGFEDMELAGYQSCVMYEPYTHKDKLALQLNYTRVVDGIPVTYVADRSAYDDSQQDYWETMKLAYDDEGLAQFLWCNPCKIYDMSDEYVFLLPFSDVLDIFEKEAPVVNQGYEGGYKEIEIKEIKLGYMWIPDISTEMEGMLIPVWDFIGSYSYIWGDDIEPIDFDQYQSFLTVNAMDGSLVYSAIPNL